MSIEVGSKVQGKVTGITHFGAFVELPNGKTGLVHISEVADSYVKDINEVLTVGQEVTVKILNVENDGKIGLSIKKAVDRPVSERPERPAGERFSRGPRPGGPGQGGPRPGGPGQGGPRGGGPRGGGPRGGGGGRREVRREPETFDTLMSKFLKDSDERLTTLKRQTDSKRGGRGAKRG
ncbi:RNA-binding protein S1 [Exiguobacterium sp. SL-10]|uniref:S1 domain-containing RNA-binding protein n=1 Tax=unclassified Exiguobacterium TaxID=2644629 RepID=UPI00103932F0|nr:MULTISPECIES: S1 domain-containing RNA-binding protein [unclassified Exiguobacterium]TCI20259.1 RNA-binding protein S1 [Exiguobacterium sp. SL-9]TCI28335.1 RNA-binding protein S1 [Exiguobacterium sp. SL-10]